MLDNPSAEGFPRNYFKKSLKEERDIAADHVPLGQTSNVRLRLLIQPVVDEAIRCVGEFRYTGAKTGSGSLTCNDGTSAELQFNSLSSISGYGFGNSSHGPASFTYGLTPEQAGEYSKLPENTRLQKNDDESVGIVTT
jgi:hypothetical protein